MKLSVILPCYNGAATLAVQMEALAAQAWPGGWELIVVDNGSTDGSAAIAEAFRDRVPDLRIVQAHAPGTPRLGVPHSYNTGIAAATGDAFVFCEADDEVAAGWLQAMGEALARHDFVAARLDHRKLNPEWLHPVHGEGYQSEHLSRLPGYPYLAHASGCAIGLRRAVWERVGAFEVALPCVHDTDYCWRAQLQGFALHLEKAALVHYREKQSLPARLRQGRNWGRDYVRLLQRYGAPTRSLPRLRRLVWVLRCLSAGVPVGLRAGLGLADGRRRLADWVWNFGWAWGEVLGTLGPPEPVRSELLALALARSTEGAQAARPSTS
ncbi:glycosyltransferase family 2 protein [Ramlibacter rhizophilus]|nr:glycosyltransferase family A protein [Ramlibacter rhizophilus]